MDCARNDLKKEGRQCFSHHVNYLELKTAVTWMVNWITILNLIKLLSQKVKVCMLKNIRYLNITKNIEV